MEKRALGHDERKRTMAFEPNRPKAVSLLCVICDRNRRDKAKAALGAHRPYLSLSLTGRGTANSRILGYLGLGEADKAVLLSVMEQAAAREAMADVYRRMELQKAGNGIVFLTRLHSGCYHRPVNYTQPADGGMAMQQDTQQYDLIMTVMNRGYSEEVMEVARGAGATGGTTLHARSFGEGGAGKFFGVEITPEKELLMIIASRESSCGIMTAIAEKTGPESDMGAVSFAVPVEAAQGLPTARLK